jgi:N-acetylmuramoyl-L-alanine amidase
MKTRASFRPAEIRSILHLRLGVIALLLGPPVLLGPSLQGAAPPSIVVLAEGQRREVLTTQGRGDVELVAIDQVVAGLGVTLTGDAAGGALTLGYQKREVSLFKGKSLASVGGDLRLLSSPVVVDQGKWLVPVDALPRLLGPLLAIKADWRPQGRVLLLGGASVPRVTVSGSLTAAGARVVFEASEKVPFRIQQEQGRITVAVPRDLVDAAVQQERLAGGIVEQILFVGGRENVFSITLGSRFRQMKAFEQEQPPRLVLDLEGAPLAPGAAAPAGPPARPASPAPTVPSDPPARADEGIRTVVIDPGHGGEDLGAQGPNGLLEKDIALAIARRLRAIMTNTLGLQVFLTRDRDAEVSLDERTAIANNYKADLFLSIHANAWRGRSASGSEVYFLSYQASDEESRRVAQSEGAALPPSSSAGAGADLALILWDMAQAEHLEESSLLATRIQEELAAVTGSQGRGVKQAPFRVLVGAAMPAVLVEVAFISNPEEEKLLAQDAFQAKVAAALARGVGRYDQEYARRAGVSGTVSRPGGQ